MYVFNGFVCGGELSEQIKIISVKVLNDMMMLLTFSNGETRLFDATILAGEVFEILKEEKIFKNPIIEHGVITWLDGQLDCAPEFMYENSYVYDTIGI